MKTKMYLIAVVVLLSLNASAQIDTNFYPEKAKDIPEEVYRNFKKRLESTYTIINENPTGEVGFIDFWNTAMCYANMSVDTTNLLNLLLKAREANSSFFCEMIIRQYEANNKDLNLIRFHKVLGNQYLDLFNECEQTEIKTKSLEELFKEKTELDLTGLNESLIDRLITLIYKDQIYRHSTPFYEKNREKQHKIDREVEKELITIFDAYGYPSKELVGEKYAKLGCLLLEHSGQPATQKKYIPLIAEAFKEDSSIGPFLSMLLDRYYMRTTGKQIFGSHTGIPFQSDKIITEVKKKFGFTNDEPNRIAQQNSKTIIVKKQ